VTFLFWKLKTDKAIDFIGLVAHTGIENVFAIFDKSAKTPNNLANKG
jgi:hypothetical protein